MITQPEALRLRSALAEWSGIATRRYRPDFNLTLDVSAGHWREVADLEADICDRQLEAAEVVALDSIRALPAR